MQRRYLQAFHDGLRSRRIPTTSPAPTPPRRVYAGRMVDLDRMHVYAWDARPYPAFPADTDAWGDGANWRLGHWLTGRIASAPLGRHRRRHPRRLRLRRLRRQPRSTACSPASSSTACMSAREALQPLELAFFLDARESDGAHRLRPPRRRRHRRRAHADDLVEPRPGAALATLTRAQETDLPASAKLTYIAADGDYPPAVEEARRLVGRSGRVALADLPLVLERRAGRRRSPRSGCSRPGPRASAPPSPCRRAVSRSSPAMSSPRRRRPLAPAAHHRDRRARRARHRGAAASTPTSTPATAPARAPQRRRRRRHRRPAARACSSTCRCCAATSRRMPATSPPRRTPGPAPSPSTARRKPPASCCKALASAAGHHRRHARSALPPAPPRASIAPPPCACASIGRARLRHRARPARRRQRCRRPERRRRLGGAAVPVRRPHRARHLRALRLSCAARPAPSTPCARPLAAGARFVLLDGALTRRSTWRPTRSASPSTGAAAPPAATSATPPTLDAAHAFTGVGLLPLSPVHVRGTRTGGDLAITWMRRTRIGGDSWDAVDVPLGEDERALRDRHPRRQPPSCARSPPPRPPPPTPPPSRPPTSAPRSPPSSLARLTSSAPPAAAAPPAPHRESCA